MVYSSGRFDLVKHAQNFFSCLLKSIILIIDHGSHDSQAQHDSRLDLFAALIYLFLDNLEGTLWVQF